VDNTKVYFLRQFFFLLFCGGLRDFPDIFCMFCGGRAVRPPGRTAPARFSPQQVFSGSGKSPPSAEIQVRVWLPGRFRRGVAMSRAAGNRSDLLLHNRSGADKRFLRRKKGLTGAAAPRSGWAEPAGQCPAGSCLAYHSKVFSGTGKNQPTHQEYSEARGFDRRLSRRYAQGKESPGYF
jgi:hypothetical protein